MLIIKQKWSEILYKNVSQNKDDLIDENAVLFNLGFIKTEFTAWDII